MNIEVVCLTVSVFTVNLSPRVAVRSPREAVTFNCSYSFTAPRNSIRTLLVQWWAPDRPRSQSLLWSASNNPGSIYGKNSEQVKTAVCMPLVMHIIK